MKVIPEPLIKVEYKIRIATWNIERLKHKKGIQDILLECEKRKPDILVLTETDSHVMPKYNSCFQTSPLKGITEPSFYNDTENRVFINTNYKCVAQHHTYDGRTSICVDLKTERGILTIYGTIIGMVGNRSSTYLSDLQNQLHDIEHLLRRGCNVCIIGDFNCSFSDNYYFTSAGRTKLLDLFMKNDISVLTADCSACIDHIAISNSFLNNSLPEIHEWNYQKNLSDHKGIMVNV